MQHDDRARCAEIFERLSGYLDLELPPDACRMIDEHLASCASCVDLVESLRRTIYLCRGYRPAEMPRPLREEARKQILEAYLKTLATRSTQIRAGGANG